jgi:hypothetical protein
LEELEACDKPRLRSESLFEECKPRLGNTKVVKDPTRHPATRCGIVGKVVYPGLGAGLLLKDVSSGLIKWNSISRIREVCWDILKRVSPV